MIAKGVTNKVFVFLFLRYLAYALQFLGTLIIAFKLGPEDYGIWAYILIIFQFFNFLNFGIPNAVNNLLSIHYQRTSYVKYVLSNGLLLLGINIVLSAIILFFLASALNVLEWKDVNLKQHGLTFFAIISLTYLNNFFLNVFRVFNKYFAISLFQVLVPLTVFIIGLCLSGTEMIDWLILAYLFANAISFVVFLITFPVNINFQYIPRVLKRLFVKSIKLFVYNSSFYFITLSLRYILSYYYSQEMFGKFSFALNISLALMLLLDAFSFIILPKFINKLSRFSASDYRFFRKIRSDYIVLSHFLIYGAILAYGVLVTLFIQYKSTFHVFVVLVLANAIYALGFGFSVLLMAKEKENLLAFISFLGLLINIFIAMIIVTVKMDFAYSGLSILITYLFLIVLQMYFSDRVIGSRNYLKSLRDIFSAKRSIPLLLTLGFNIFGLPYVYYGISFLIFLALNTQELKSVFLRFKGLIYNPSQVDLK